MIHRCPENVGEFFKKKANARKTLESLIQIDEHFQQLAAYAMAHDNMFNTKIEKAMIFIAYKESYDYEVIEADSSLLKSYKDMWMDKLQYYSDVSQ